jgi:hypothetical protein
MLRADLSDVEGRRAADGGDPSDVSQGRRELVDRRGVQRRATNQKPAWEALCGRVGRIPSQAPAAKPPASGYTRVQ